MTFRNTYAHYAGADPRAVTSTGQGPWSGGAFATGHELESLASLLTPIRLSAGQALDVADAAVSHVYLVEAGAVAVSVPLPNGETIGVQISHPGDMLGLDALFIQQPARTSAVTLVAGAAKRVSVSSLAKACLDRPDLSSALAAVLARQTRALQMELACCRRHSVEQRLARLLLELSQRLGRPELPLTQEQLAFFLGVQRTTITSLAGRLRSSGAVTYTRGVVRVINRTKLAAISCQCCAG